jgi:hypothetical protein
MLKTEALLLSDMYIHTSVLGVPANQIVTRDIEKFIK